jgi:hypothetical protein
VYNSQVVVHVPEKRRAKETFSQILTMLQKTLVLVVAITASVLDAALITPSKDALGMIYIYAFGGQ